MAPGALLVRGYTILYYTILYDTIRYDTILYYAIFFGRPYATRRKQHCLSLKSVRRLCRSVLLGVSCTLATSLGNSKIGGLQLSCELVDRKKGR